MRLALPAIKSAKAPTTDEDLRLVRDLKPMDISSGRLGGIYITNSVLLRATKAARRFKRFTF